MKIKINLYIRITNFSKCFKSNNQKILNKSDPDKIFNVEILLTYMDTELEKNMKKKDKIREDFSDYDFNFLYKEIKNTKPKEFKKYTLDFNLNDEDFDDFKNKILEFQTVFIKSYRTEKNELF